VRWVVAQHADPRVADSVKAGAKHLGVSISVMYELVNRGEIAHVMIGSRRYISRDQISAFI
jgi:excisionase family DNA binding protein